MPGLHQGCGQHCGHQSRYAPFGYSPHHTKWMRLFENLKYVVIDELHIYRSVFDPMWPMY